MNRGLSSLLTGIVGIVVGFGWAWALFSESPSSLEGGTASHIETQVVEPARKGEARPAELSVLEPEPGREARRVSSAPAPSAGSRSVTGWSEAELLDRSWLEPTGRITGTVRDESGSPMAGVRIVASASSAPDAIELSSPHDVELETYLRSRAAYYHWLRATTRETRTDASGAFVLDDLVDARHRVEGKLEGYRIEGSGEWWRVELGRTVDLVAKREYGLELRVLEATGEPAKAARIRWRDGNSTTSVDWKASEPRLDLSAGTFEIWAEREDFRSQSETITLVDGETPPPLTLQLAPRNGLRGRVIFPEGEVVERAVLTYLPVSGPDVDLSAKQLASDGQSSWIRPDEPEFAILDIEPGWWAVGIGRQWNQVDHLEIHQVPLGVARRDIELPPLTRDRALVVWTRGPDGRPVHDVEFRVAVDTGYRRSTRGAEATRKPEDGSYWILLDDDSRAVLAGDQEGEVTLNAESAAYGARSLVVSPSAEPSAEVVFGARATLTVDLSGDTTSYVGSLQVRLIEEDARDGEALTSETVGTSTSTLISPVQPGTYHVVLASSNGLELDRVDLRLHEGDNRVTLEVPPLYELTVLLGEGSPGGLSIKRHRSETGPSFSQRRDPDESGRVVFTNVPAGDYTLQLYGRGGVPQIMNVSVPSQGEVRFEAQEVNALAVTVRDPGGVMAKAGFQTGDLVIAIGDQEIVNLQSAMSAMYAAMAASERIRFTVLRGGSRLTLEVDAQKLQGNAGGDLDPTTR